MKQIQFRKGTIIVLIMCLYGVISKAQYSGAYTSAYFNGTIVGVSCNETGVITNSIKTTTFEAWVKKDTALSNSIQTIFSAPSTTSSSPLSNNFMYVYIKADTIFASYGDTAKIRCAFPTDTLWHHIAFLCDTAVNTSTIAILTDSRTDSLTLFIDGQYQTKVTSGHTNLSSNISGSMLIGAAGSNPYAASISNYFFGHICRVVYTDSILYTGNFIPDCVFDTTQYITTGAFTTALYPTMFIQPLNGNDTLYTQNGPYYILPNTYSYKTSPCEPVLKFISDTSAIDSVVNIAINTNHSYMKGAWAPIHYNGWDTSLHTLRVYCPNSTYGYFADTLTVYNDTILHYWSDYFRGTSTHTDTITASTKSINIINSAHIGVFPIPANAYLNIICTDFISAEIIDFNGRALLKSTEKKLSISNLPAGNYLLKINTLNGFVADKILILH